MPGPRKESRRAEEDANLWFARRDAFCEEWKAKEDERQLNREALALRLRNVASRQVDLHIPFRIYGYYASQAYDEFPETRYPKEGAGDAKFGPVCEKYLDKDLGRAGADRVFRAVLADVITDGCGVVAYGLPRFPTPLEVASVGLDVDTAVQTVLAQGGYEVTAGMDHEALSEGLKAHARDSARMMGLPRWIQAALFNQAAIHEYHQEKEAKTPVDWRRTRGNFWCERRIPATSVYWDTDSSEINQSRFWIEKLLHSVEELKEVEAFSPEGRKALEAQDIPTEDPNRDEIEDAPNLDGSTTHDERIQADIKDRGLVEVLRVFDKQYETWHYVARPASGQGDAFYLEEDEQYPYMDLGTMEPALDGFFPFVHVAPYQSNERSVQRTFGVPLMSLAMPVIEMLIQYESEAAGQTKRNVRHPGYHPELWRGGEGEAIVALTSGRDGEGFEIPLSIWNSGARETGVRYVEVPKVPADLKVDRERAWNLLSHITGIPKTALTGEAVAPTKAQEEIVEARLGAQTNDMVGQLECAWSSLAKGCITIARLTKTPKDIGLMLGAKAEAAWSDYLNSDITTDRLQSTFSQRQMDYRKAEQLMKAIDMAIHVQGLVPIDIVPLLEELWRCFGLGEIQMVQQDPTAALGMLRGEADARGVRGGPEANAPTPATGRESTTVPDPQKAEGAIGRNAPMPGVAG